MRTLKEFEADFFKEFPLARIVEKKGWFWVTLHWLVLIFTFGGNRKFITDYWTSIWWTLGYPLGHKLTDYDVDVLEHEAKHFWQIRNVGLWILIVLTLGLGYLLRNNRAFKIVASVVGCIPYSIAYLLLPVPFGFAMCRYMWEREAYVVSLRCTFERYGIEAAKRAIPGAVEQMTSGKYGYTFILKKSVNEYFTNKVKQFEIP